MGAGLEEMIVEGDANKIASHSSHFPYQIEEEYDVASKVAREAIGFTSFHEW